MADDLDWNNNFWTHELGTYQICRGLLITLSLLKNRLCYPNSGVRSGVCWLITVFGGVDELAEFCQVRVLLESLIGGSSVAKSVMILGGIPPIVSVVLMLLIGFVVLAFINAISSG